jgi:hypothetical protein
MSRCNGVTASAGGTVTLAYTAPQETTPQQAVLSCGAEADMVMAVLQSMGVACVAAA